MALPIVPTLLKALLVSRTVVYDYFVSLRAAAEARLVAIEAANAAPVADSAAIRAIAPASRSNGMVVIKLDTGDAWEFVSGSSTGANAWTLVPTVAGSGAAAGRWKRLYPSLLDLASVLTGFGASLIGIEDVATIYTATTVEGALAEVKAIADAGMPLLKKTVTVAFNNAALVAANSNGASAAVNIGTALPNNARIAFVNLKLATPFTGGSASAVTVDIGVSGDLDALVDGADVLAAAVDGQASSAPVGIAPHKHYASGGQLVATFAPDAGHQLANLSAGSVVIDVTYTILA